MTAARRASSPSAMENRHYASREEYVRAVAAALRTEYRAIVDRGLLLQIDAPDLALERHTLFADRPLAGVPRAGSSSSSTPSTARSTASTRAGCGCTCAGATTRARTPTTSPFDEIQPLLYEAQRRRARGLDGQRPPRPRVPLLRAPPAARRHGARRRRDRHDEQLRRAPRGGRRPARTGSRERSATRTGSSPAPTAASTPRPASATSRRRWCGRSCAPCAPAPTWRPTACSDGGQVTGSPRQCRKRRTPPTARDVRGRG